MSEEGDDDDGVEDDAENAEGRAGRARPQHHRLLPAPLHPQVCVSPYFYPTYETQVERTHPGCSEMRPIKANGG